MSKFKKISLIGTFSAYNKGDAAMQLVAIEELSKIPNNKISIITPNIDYDSNIYNKVTTVSSGITRILKAIDTIIRSFLWNLIKNVFKKDIEILLNTDELKTIYNSDLIIDLSGDMLTDSYGFTTKCYKIISIYIVKLLKKPLYVCAQSIGPFRNHGITGFFFKKILNYAKLITVREQITHKYIKKIIRNQDKLFFTSDLSFLFSPLSKQKAKELLKKAEISNNDKLIGISVSTYFKRIIDKKNPSKREFLEIIVETIDTICKETDYKFIIVSHVTGPMKYLDDRIVGKKLYKRIKNKEKVYFLEKDYHPKEIKGIIGLCDCFIGVRMHSNISALSQGIPVIAIDYSYKAKGIMHEFEMDDFVIPINKLNKKVLIKKIKKLIRHKELLSNKIKEKLREIKKKAQKNITLIQNFLEK